MKTTKRLEVEAKVFSMGFWGKGFTIDDVSFVPLENQHEIQRRIQQDRVHYQTGIAKVAFPINIGCDKAIEKAREILDDYSMLLSFAQGHHVFFHEYSCYEIEDGARKFKGSSIHMQWIGKPVGAPNILSPGTETFLRNSVPLIRNESFAEQTGIIRSIQWYNEATSLNVLEARFPALWIGMETLASAYAMSHEKELILSEDELETLQGKFHDFIKFDLKIEPNERRAKLYRNLKCLQREPITEQISYLLQHYSFEQYKSEIPIFYDLRNTIVHGRSIDYIISQFKNPFEIERKLERVLEKLILSVLNFYDNQYVHSAIQQDDLLARG